MTPRLTVRATFERFPATVKGAFILRGEDPDPHQVLLRGARVVPVGGGPSRPVPLLGATLDIAPKQDVFVPFETPITELEPGWYELECDLDVDGLPGTYAGGRRFVVPWPRATTRRGQVRVGKDVRLAAGRVRFGPVECGADSIRVSLQAPRSHPVTVRLSADGEPLHVLEASHDDDTGRARIVAYPLLKAHRSLRIEVRVGRGDDGEIEVALP